jgi:hypothetical protein
MYDEFSLSRLLEKHGFADIKRETSFTSRMPEWTKYELDVKNGEVYDPYALIMEGIKNK